MLVSPGSQAGTTAQHHRAEPARSRDLGIAHHCPDQAPRRGYHPQRQDREGLRSRSGCLRVARTSWSTWRLLTKKLEERGRGSRIGRGRENRGEAEDSEVAGWGCGMDERRASGERRGGSYLELGALTPPAGWGWGWSSALRPRPYSIPVEACAPARKHDELFRADRQTHCYCRSFDDQVPKRGP